MRLNDGLLTFGLGGSGSICLDGSGSQARGASVLTYRLCKLQPAGVTGPLLPSLPPRRANAPCKMDGYLSLRDRVQRAVQPNLGRTELGERGRGQQSRHFSGANNFIAAWRGQGAVAAVLFPLAVPATSRWFNLHEKKNPKSTAQIQFGEVRIGA